MPFPRIHPTLSRVSETATRYITAKTPSVEARQEKLEAAARQLLARRSEPHRIQLHYRHSEARRRMGTRHSNIQCIVDSKGLNDALPITPCSLYARR